MDSVISICVCKSWTESFLFLVGRRASESERKDTRSASVAVAVASIVVFEVG